METEKRGFLPGTRCGIVELIGEASDGSDKIIGICDCSNVTAIKKIYWGKLSLVACKDCYKEIKDLREKLEKFKQGIAEAGTNRWINIFFKNVIIEIKEPLPDIIFISCVKEKELLVDAVLEERGQWLLMFRKIFGPQTQPEFSFTKNLPAKAAINKD